MTKKTPAAGMVDSLANYRNENLLDKDPRSKDTQVLHVPLTKAEHKELKAEAAARDQSMAQYFRAMWSAFKKEGNQ
jgi:hypothetical protein